MPEPTWHPEPGQAGFRPFRRGRFSALPERPRLPHGYDRTESREVVVPTAAWGPVRVHVRIAGSGPPLLLVHGLMTSSYSWRYVLMPLAERFTVYAPDLPGSGRSDRPQGPFGSDVFAEFLESFTRTLGIAGCAVVGNSLGGYQCLHWIRRHPTSVGRLVVLHAPGIPQLRLLALSLLLLVPPLRSLLAAWVRRDPRRWAFEHVHYWDESLKSAEEAAAYGDPLATPEGAAAFVGILGQALRPPSMDRLLVELVRLAAGGQRLGERVLLLYAKADPMVPPWIGPRLAEHLPGARFVWLERGSHFAHVDAPDLFLAHALPFLAGPSAD